MLGTIVLLFVIAVHFGPMIWIFHFIFYQDAMYDFTGGDPHYAWWYDEQKLSRPKKCRQS